MFQAMLKDILAAYGPSGREEKIAEVLRGYVAPYVDEVYTDALGNLIAHKKGSGKKVMLSAHMDQIGLVVTDIDDNGFLRAMNVGGVNPVMAVGRQVKFANGVMGVTYFETEKLTLKEATFKELFIDVGASTKEEARAKADIGDMCVFYSPMVELGDRIAGAVLDDRLCCAILVEALQQLDTPHDVYAVFTVQEEVGLRGAGAAAFAIQPDLNINLDVTLVGDTPKCARMSVVLGKGPTVKAMDASLIVPVKVRDFMKDTAKKQGIPVQDEVLFGGGTDTAAVQRSRSGVLAGCISVPTRYVHSPVETADMSDVMNAVKLVRALLKETELPTA